MGTWQLKVANISGSSITGVWNPSNIAAVIANILPPGGGVNNLNLASIPGSWLLRLAFDSAEVVLDDNFGSPVPFASLPIGFTITSATIRFDATVDTGSGLCDVFLQSDPITEQQTINDTVAIPPSSTVVSLFEYDFSGPIVPTMLDVVNNGCGLRLEVITTLGSVFQVSLSGGDSQFSGSVRAFGDYFVAPGFQYTISPSSGSEVDPEETITLTSDPNDPTHLLLDQLTLSVPCGLIAPTVQTETLLIFTVPASCSNNGPTVITATGNGTQFSGSVPLGTLNIMLANASGIYKLSPGKSNDTLYSGARDGSTYDVKIPDPFAKIGFIGG